MSPRNLPKWFKRLPVWAVLLTYIFVATGLINSVLCMLALVVWPFSKSAYRRIATRLAYNLLSLMVWCCVDWADVSITLFGAEETFGTFGKESCLVTLSHRGDFDWLIGYVLADYYGFIQTIRTTPKKSVLYVPGFGQLLWAMECPFLSRSWTKDEPNLRKSLKAYASYPFPIQVCLFCEGSRFSQEKFEKGVEYAKREGLTPLKYHLVPRTKGYSIIAHSLKHEAGFEMSYDIGFAYPKGQYYKDGVQMQIQDILAGHRIEAFINVTRIPFEDVPSSSSEELQRFCHKLYVDKDQAYDYFASHGRYPGPSRKVVFPQAHINQLRLNLLFWFLVTVLLPGVWLLSKMVVTGLVQWILPLLGLGTGLVILTRLLLIYARPSKRSKKSE